MRAIPHDIGAERAILGAALLSGDLGVADDHRLTDGHFYREPHRLLWRTLTDIRAAGSAIDMVTVGERLEALGKMDTIGGFSYLAGLPASTPSVANLSHYIKIVKGKAHLRSLLTMASELTEAIYSGEQSPEEIIADAEGQVFGLSEQVAEGTGLRRIASSVERVHASIRQRAEMPSDVQGIPTGLAGLDRVLSGLIPEALIILAARPAMGKTALAMNIVEHVSVDRGFSVAVFSLEMGTDQLTERVIAGKSRVLADRLKTGRLLRDDWVAFEAACAEVHSASIHIDDSPNQTLAGIASKCRRLKKEDGLDLVVIDYLQLMKGTGKEGSREQEISGISRGLKGLAKEFRIPVIALSQLNRGVENRQDKRPNMADLRESGAIEQDADQIAFLYRDEVYNEHTEMRGIAEVLVRKNRHGDTANVKLRWRGEITRFEDLVRDGVFG